MSSTIRRTIELTVDLSRYESNQDLVVDSCCVCGSPIAMVREHYKGARADRTVTFYCSHGHANVYSQTRVQELEDALTQAQEIGNAEATKRQQAEAMLAAAQAKQKRHAQAGLCQFCRRHFLNLERHSKTKHTTGV